MGFIQQIFGSKNQRELKKLQPTVARIGELGPTMAAKSDDELRAMTAEFKRRIDKGATLDEILPEAFAVVREAGTRILGMRHYDVQLIGGMVLHQGKIAEMRTGEGKTLVATLPTYLNALEGKGVHVVTVNDYLARRDSEWMGRLHGFLGLTTGVVVHGLEDFERQRAYNCDITYGQNNEFGFDYLRDNMKTSPDRMVQRGLHYGVVDEVDSILIDEARTPLIISGPAEESADSYVKVDRIIPRLKREVDFAVDEKAHSTMLTDEGVERVEKLLGIDNLYDPQHLSLNHHVVQALRAHTLYKRDVNYLVEDHKVVIVDEFTGRKMPGRRWSDGLHQAIEAKEGVTIEEENQTLATVTFQNYFRMYKKLSGMTGTADTEATEFHQIYKLEVVVIPTNKPIVRNDQPDLVYKNEKGKFKAVFTDIEDCYQRGQPVLVGTVSVEKSEVLAQMLRAKNLPFHVLNAKQHQREAFIVAQAGRKGAITISTNMAGRGTDILLGGNAEYLAKSELEEEKTRIAETAAAAATGDSPDGDAGPYRGASTPAFDEDQRLAELQAQFKERCESERKDVLAAGGLKIIGTERHESRRIDNQLRGRAGRQGDPGASRFYLSLEDDLLRIFGLDRMASFMERLGLEEDVPIESPMVTRSIEGAQKKVEGRNFDTRKNVLEYDDVMNQQRKTIYALRRQILEGRYEPELSDDDKKKGLTSEPPTESGDWTVDGLRQEMRPKVAEMVKGLLERLAVRDADMAAGKQVPDTRPAWRVLRAELWRQYGALIDTETLLKDSEAPVGASPVASDAVLDVITRAIAQSLVSQRERIYDLCDSLIGRSIEQVFSTNVSEEEWDIDALEDALREQFAIEFELEHGTNEEIAAQTWAQVEKRLAAREQELTRPWFMYFARHFALEEIDNQWIEHLKTMDALREGIGLQGYGQKDPKKEYKKAGYDLFADMMARMQSNTATKLFRVQIQREEAAIPTLEQRERQMVEAGAAGKTDEDGGDEVQRPAAQRRPQLRPGQPGRGPSAGGPPAAQAAPVETVRRDKPKVGRNDPCPCGSGKKYKKCHGRDEAEAAQD